MKNCYVIIKYYGIDANSYYSSELPVYPDEISDSFSASWTPQQIVGRSSPIAAYTGTDFRNVSFSMNLHRELLAVNGNPTGKMESLLRTLQKSVYPQYLSQGLIPPTTIFRLGDFFAKGFVESVSFAWQKPIIDEKYMVADVSINMSCYADSVIGAINLGSSVNPFNTVVNGEPYTSNRNYQ